MGYFVSMQYLALALFSYPICARFSESCNTASATVCYLVLDILSTPVFLIGFLVYVSWFSDQQFRMIAFGGAEQDKTSDESLSVTGEKEDEQTWIGPQAEVAPDTQG